jgi:hypothetical protein
MCETTEERKQAFETAKAGMDAVVVDRVMKGLPVLGGNDQDPKVRALRQARARYYERLK